MASLGDATKTSKILRMSRMRPPPLAEAREAEGRPLVPVKTEDIQSKRTERPPLKWRLVHEGSETPLKKALHCFHSPRLGDPVAGHCWVPELIVAQSRSAVSLGMEFSGMEISNSLLKILTADHGFFLCIIS